MNDEDLQKMKICAIWLIKNLCIDTDADSADLEQGVTHQGKSIGRYKITIAKLNNEIYEK